MNTAGEVLTVTRPEDGGSPFDIALSPVVMWSVAGAGALVAVTALVLINLKDWPDHRPPRRPGRSPFDTALTERPVRALGLLRAQLDDAVAVAKKTAAGTHDGDLQLVVWHLEIVAGRIAHQIDSLLRRPADQVPKPVTDAVRVSVGDLQGVAALLSDAASAATGRATSTGETKDLVDDVRSRLELVDAGTDALRLPPQRPEPGT